MMSRYGLPIEKRLLNKREIDPETGCWLWTGHCVNGYGQIWIKGKNQYVHRVSYEEFIGPLKELALHKQICKNKHCFNPDHLYDGNACDNTYDSIKTNTHHFANVTHCPQGHKYTKENTYMHWNRRHCRKCMKIKDQGRRR